MRKFLTWLVELMSALPEPRTYDGNPSAGSIPSEGEKDYENARDAAKKPDYKISHTWRW